MTIGDLIVRVGAQIDGFKSAMGEVSSSLASTASKMASVGTTMTAAVTLPLVGVGVAALKTAGELEQNTIAFKTLLGSATEAQKHLEALRAFAAKTPFQFTELVTASKRMQALGFESKEVLPTLRTVGDAAAALGMGAEGIQRIVTALGQMKAKGMVQAEEMRQLAEAGIPAWQILAKTLNTDVAGAMKMVEKRTVEAATAIPAILAGMNEKFGGLMAQQAKTLLGQWSDLKDQITFTLTDIGTALMPLAKSAFENVLKPALATLKDLATGFAALPQPVQTATLGIVGFAAVIGPTMLVVGKLIAVVGDLSKIFTLTLIPSIVSLSNVVASLGSKSFGLLVASFSNVGMGYAAMLATGVLRVAGWLALAAAILELVQAYRGLQDAKAGLASAEKTQQDSLLKLEIALKRQGANISDLQKQYAQGQITWTQYMQALRDISLELGKTAQAHEEHKKVVKLTADQIKEAFSDLGIKDLKKEIAEAVAAFQRLTAAGLLTQGQMREAAFHIAALRRELAELGKLPQVDLVKIAPTMPSISDLANLPSGIHGGVTQDDLAILAQYNRVLQTTIDTLGALSTQTALATRETGYLTDAYHLFNMKTPEELKKTAEQSRAAYEMIRDSGTAVPETIFKAWVQMTRDKYELMRADGRVTEQQYKDMMAALDATHKQSSERRRGYERTAADDMRRSMESAFDNLSRGLARSIIEWKDWGKNIKSVALNLAEDLLSTMIKSFIEPFKQQLAGLAASFGKMIADIFTGGSGSSGGSSGGSNPVGSIAGSGPSGGLGGTSNSGSGGGGGAAAAAPWVGIALQATAEIVAGFQRARTNDRLELINQNTLKSFNILTQMLTEMYVSREQFMLKYDDIWGEIRNVVAAVRGPLGNVSAGVFESIRDSAALQVRKIDEFIIPKMDKMITLLAGGAKSSGNTFNFSIQSNDPRAVVDEVAAYLKAQGVYV